MSLIWTEPERCGKWLIERVPFVKQWMNGHQAIGLEIDGELTAVVVYENFTGYDISMSLAVEKRATKGFVRAAFAYPFIQLGCQRISGEVASRNKPIITLIERLGFTVEGVKRNAIPGDDLIQYGMLRSECRHV